MNEAQSHQRLSFAEFYRTVFLAEHTHPVNIALHITGTLLGTVLIPGALLIGSPWLIPLYPVVHALPGLIGHRFLERNVAVGDIRVMRKDYSPLWFIVGNHILTYQVAARGVRRLLRR